MFRAVTIRRCVPDVFRLLCQLRVAPYSYDWIDNRGDRSPQELLRHLDNLVVGQRFMQILELVDFKPNEQITLAITHAGARRMFGEVVGSYVVKSKGPSDTRLLVKLVVRRTAYRPFTWVGPLLPWGDLIMMRKQLMTLKDSCERPLATR